MVAARATRPRLGKPDGLRARRDFLRVQTQGRRLRGEHMLVLVARQGEDLAAAVPSSRVGYTVSRKVGNAVVRNRVRRRLREIVRTSPDALTVGRDYVIIAFPSAANAAFETLREELRCLLQKARDSTSRKPS